MVNELVPTPTGVRSIVSGLPSLDEMLSGGIRGTCLIAGVTSVGKTTLAMSYLANREGVNAGQSAGVMDFGERQGQERYLQLYGSGTTEFHQLVISDHALLRESANALEYDGKLDGGRGSSVKSELMWLRMLFENEGILRSSRIREARLGTRVESEIVRIDMRNIVLEGDEVRRAYYSYFGERDLEYLDHIMSAWLFYNARTNGTNRFFIDGISADPKKQEYILELIRYYSGERKLALPFIGTNFDEFKSAHERKNRWRVEKPANTLVSLTLYSADPSENVGDINDAINNAQRLKLAQEFEGVIVLGRNIRGRYAFANKPSTPAPQMTRILAIPKSRYKADETFREYSLDEAGKPVLGKVMVYRP